MFTVLFVKHPNWRLLILVFVISMNPDITIMMDLLISTVMVRSVSSQPILVLGSNALSIIRRDFKMIQCLKD